MPTLTQAAAAPAVASEAEEQLYRKVLKRILPLLLLCYVVAYLDRVNVGFAKLQMLDALASATAFTPWAPASSSGGISSLKCPAIFFFTNTVRGSGLHALW